MKIKKLEIIVDTRERIPYTFADFPIVEITHQKLDTGDYSLIGHENCICIERKEMGDFLNCITNDRERFERECVRMLGIKYRFVIVESGLSETFAHVYNKGNFSPETMLGTVVSWEMKYGIYFHFVKARYFGEHLCYRILYNYMRLLNLKEIL